MSAWFYILRLRSGKLYTGAAINLEQRYQDHLNGTACRTTKSDSPIRLIYTERLATFKDVRKREAQVKRWSRAKKEALASGDLDRLKKLAKSRQGK